MSDPAYPGQWRVSGAYIEQIAKMTHWEYPEAIERFGRQLEALGISAELERRGARESDLVMVDKYDFDFSPGMTNPYIPKYLLEEEIDRENARKIVSTSSPEDTPWLPFGEGGYLNVDVEELMGFDAGDWDLLEDDLDEDNDDDDDDDESGLDMEDEA